MEVDSIWGFVVEYPNIFVEFPQKVVLENPTCRLPVVRTGWSVLDQQRAG